MPGDPLNPEKPPASQPAVTRTEVDEFTLRLTGRYGSADAALRHIAGEQLKYRRRAQNAETALKDLQKQIPTAGSVVLSAEDASALHKLRTDVKGFDLKTVGDQLKELSEMKTTQAKKSRSATIVKAAGDTYDEKVLERLVGDLPIEFKNALVPDEDEDDKMVEVSIPYLKVGDTLEPMDKWLEREHPRFKDIVLKQVADDDDEEDAEQPQGRQERRPAKKEKDKEPAARMPRQSHNAPAGKRSGVKNEEKEMLKAVDKQMSTHMSPGMRRKAEAGTT